MACIRRRHKVARGVQTLKLLLLGLLVISSSRCGHELQQEIVHIHIERKSLLLALILLLLLLLLIHSSVLTFLLLKLMKLKQLGSLLGLTLLQLWMLLWRRASLRLLWMLLQFLKLRLQHLVQLF